MSLAKCFRIYTYFPKIAWKFHAALYIIFIILAPGFIRHFFIGPGCEDSSKVVFTKKWKNYLFIKHSSSLLSHYMVNGGKTYRRQNESAAKCIGGKTYRRQNVSVAKRIGGQTYRRQNMSYAQNISATKLLGSWKRVVQSHWGAANRFSKAAGELQTGFLQPAAAILTSFSKAAWTS